MALAYTAATSACASAPHPRTPPAVNLPAPPDLDQSAPALLPRSPVSLTQALGFWLKLGFISFGGPAGQIAIMHTELVERRRWISEKRFLHALNYCMVLPGPEAQQLATYIGWLMHRTRGALVAGGLFVLPSLFLLIALSWVYLRFGDVPLVAGLFYGIKPAVTAVVLHAAHRIGSRALQNLWMWALAAAAFVAIFFFSVPFPAIVLAAALTGLVVWALAMGVLLATVGPQGTLTQMGWFFTKAALLTFGGAYAVLPYVYQGAVE
ncbi:MAG: chromate transporter, partial [Burkholderiaceae bacterium]|nr:chromate transporter [Burkholderiaceae bacterium]